MYEFCLKCPMYSLCLLCFSRWLMVKLPMFVLWSPCVFIHLSIFRTLKITYDSAGPDHVPGLKIPWSFLLFQWRKLFLLWFPHKPWCNQNLIPFVSLDQNYVNLMCNIKPNPFGRSILGFWWNHDSFFFSEILCI